MCPRLDMMESEIKVLFDLPDESILQHLIPLHLQLLSFVGGVWKVIPRGKLISSNGLKWDWCSTVFIPSTECLYLKPGGRQNYSMFEKSTLSWSIQPFILLVFLNCSLSLSQRNPEAFVVSSVKCFTILLSSGFHSGVKMPHDRRLYWKLYVIGWSKAAGTWYIKKLCCLTDFLQKSGCTFL